MSVAWFDKRPGEDVAAGTEDPTMILVGAGVPDWVRLPPELGGHQAKVVEATIEPCPRGDHDVRHLKLNNGICVAECSAHGGFLWYRRKETT